MRTRICLIFAFALLAAAPAARGQTGEAWPQPSAESLPAGAFREAVLYGRKLFNETYSVMGPEVRDSAMRYSGNNLSCQSCHLQGGTQRFAIPMVGVYGLFPLYIAREDEVEQLQAMLALFVALHSQPFCRAEKFLLLAEPGHCQVGI